MGLKAYVCDGLGALESFGEMFNVNHRGNLLLLTMVPNGTHQCRMELTRFQLLIIARMRTNPDPDPDHQIIRYSQSQCTITRSDPHGIEWRKLISYLFEM